MKKQIFGILIILSLGVFSWAQGTNEFFDGKKCQEELEIMKGILKTKISFVDQNKSQTEISLWRNPSINAFYLAGQGAVFVIPISSYPSYSLDISRALEATKESLSNLRDNLNFVALEDGTLLAPALPAPPAPPAPPVPFKSSASSQVDDEKFQDAMDKYQEMIEKNQKKYQEMVEKYQGKLQEMAEKYQKGISKTDEERRKKQKDLLEKFEARAEKNREEAQKKREKLLQSLADIKANLIETLANYGDSLTTVKSDEYINLVLNTEDPEAANKKRSDTISAQKSWITDYKAGRLSLQDFRGKVLQYTQ